MTIFDYHLANNSGFKQLNRLRLKRNCSFNTNKEKADLFAENLEKKFNSETNSNFDKLNFKKVEEFTKTPLEDKFSQSERTVKEFTYADLVKALKEMNNKTLFLKSTVV